MKLLRSILAVLLAFVAYGTTYAQGFLVDQTSINIPTFRSETTDFSTRFNNGSTFVGQRFTQYANSQINHVSYSGTLTFPDGTKVISVKHSGSYDQRFAANGHFAIEQNGTITTFAEFKNGEIYRTYTPTKKYYMNNHCIEFYYTEDTAVTINGVPVYGGSSGYSSGSNNSSSGSGYVSNRATCAGCQGTGKCHLCHGRGYNDRGYKCSLCHGTGTCQTCQGVGKLTVY